MSPKLAELFDEAWPLARMWVFAQRALVLPKDEKLAFCYGVLNKVSRSFAIVIQQLPTELRDPVCVFYLVLRALDTVEDDMAIPVEEKVPILRAFHEKIFQRGWTKQCGEKEYANLMANYALVTDVFLSLSPQHQKVIAEITRRMGAGMAEFIEREVITVEDYDLYCHYVAGLVGIGLSQLFAASGLETARIGDMEDLSNGMGLFLQKTNIIRDYLEDIMEEPAPRMFWPKEIWGLHAAELADFKLPTNKEKAVAALNHMVTDALRHAPESLQYMSNIRNTDIFRFCAIPQVMAIATLAEIHNNPNVFTGVVKVRRGLVARYMIGLNSLPDLHRAFAKFAAVIVHRCKTEAMNDPMAATTITRAQKLVDTSSAALKNMGQPLVAPRDWPGLVGRLGLLVLVAAMVVRSTAAGSALAQLLLHLLITAPTFLVAALFIYSSSQNL